MRLIMGQAPARKRNRDQEEKILPIRLIPFSMDCNYSDYSTTSNMENHKITYKTKGRHD